MPEKSAIHAALATVIDPEIRRPITDLGMVDDVRVDDAGVVFVTVLLTVEGCPLQQTIDHDVRQALAQVAGVTDVQVTLGTMTDEQRAKLRETLHGGAAEREIPFARDDSRTQVVLVASGKGGVGKSSVAANLAAALAQRGLSVGVLDADIYGHSIPPMFGLRDAVPTMVDDMIMPVPASPAGVSVMSIGMLKQSPDQVIAWRGPILDRALQQFLADVYWGDLDFLVIDLPPGTGDVALSLGHKLPNAGVLVVTTPQQASADVAERAGTMASMVNQRVIGVVENMAYLDVACPDCGAQTRVDVFGEGGGRRVAATLTARLGYDVPLLAEVPIDPGIAASGDSGVPMVVSNPDSGAARALAGVADRLAGAEPQ